MPDPNTLAILIDIRSRLDEITKTQREMRGLTEETKDANKEANSLGSAFRTGFGIDVARRGMNLLTQSLRANVGEALRLASYTKDVAQNLTIDTEPLQVLSLLVKDAGGDFENLNQGIIAYRAQLASARTGTGEAAKVFQRLYLSADELSRLPLERQIELVAQRMLAAGKGTIDFDAAVSLLGRRNAPKLMQALKELAEQGYDKVAKSAKDAGQVMEKDSIERLDRAQKQIEKLKRKITIDVGEGLAAMDLLRESASKDPGGTLFGWLKAGFTGDYTDLTQTVITNVPPPKVTTPPVPTAPLATSEEMIMARLQFTSEQLARVGNNPLTTEIQKRGQLLQLLGSQEELLQDLIELKYADVGVLEHEGKMTAEQLARLEERSKLEAKINDLRNQQRAVGGLAPSAYTGIREQATGINDPTINKNYLGVGEGFGAGAMQWVTQLGSAGQQVAGLINSSIGSAVSAVSEGIYGWITGAQSFSDVLIDLGATILQTILQTIIQMGVQWLINAAISRAVAAASVASSLALSAAAASATAVIWAPAATLSTIATLGGAAAQAPMSIMAAKGIVMATAATGFFDGGYTGYGGKYDVAGPVHRGEVVYSQADIARHGGVEAVEAMRLGGPEALVETMAVPMPVPLSPVAAAAPLTAASIAAAGAGSRRREKQPRFIAVDNRRVIDHLEGNPAFENIVQEMITRNPSKYGIPS